MWAAGPAGGNPIAGLFLPLVCPDCEGSGTCLNPSHHEAPRLFEVLSEG